MENLWEQMKVQTLALNKLCRRNGFENADNKTAYQLQEMGQTFAVESFTGLCKSELNHIESIADAFVKANRDVACVNIRNSPFFGGKFTHSIETFPVDDFFAGKLKSQFTNFGLARLDWSVDTYIESIRFTMTDGSVSPKYGNKAFTSCCDFAGPVKKIVATYRERGLVSLTIFTANDELRIEGSGEGKQTDTVEVMENVETLIQFKVRIADNHVRGISFGISTLR